MDSPNGRGPRTVFVSKLGQPLPKWLQDPLERQRLKLMRDFPSLRDLAVVQDLLDAVGQRVLEKSERGDTIEGVEAFISTAARNAAVSYLRGGDIFSHGTSVPVQPQLTVTPSEHLWWGKLLTNEEGELVVRHLWMGERHEEIAQFFGVPVSTIRNRYARIIAKLRAAWTESICAHRKPSRTESLGPCREKLPEL